MSEDQSTIRTEGEKTPLLGQAPYDAAGLGRLWLTYSDRGLVGLQLSDDPPTHGDDAAPPTTDVPEPYRAVLDAYFRGEDVDPATLPVDLRGTQFQVRVWEALRRVPRGKVRAYGGIAADVGSPRAMRAVGVAAGHNPVLIVVPCHRVIAHDDTLGGFSAGLDVKRKLLRLEGVDVEGDIVRPGQLEMF